MKKLLWAAAALLLLAATACTDEESELGLGLTDPATLYNGHIDTLYASTAYSLRDDSLVTSNFSYGIIGNHTDATFGSVSSVLYTQIGLASGMSTINFDEVSIDSVVLSMVVDGLYPDTSMGYNFHFEVMQLAEQLLSDTDYYSFDSLAVNPSAVFFNAPVTVGAHDTVVRLRLNTNIYNLLSQSNDSAGFMAATKGLRIRITDAGDEGMLSVNFASTLTCMTAYYHYGTDTIPYNYQFLTGAGVNHFTHFRHNYSGTIFNGQDSLDGSMLLYLMPLAGYNIRLGFDTQLQAFHAAHPMAVIHHAELLLPTAPSAPALHPEQLVALRINDAGTMSFVPDYADAYTYRGFDGKYDEGRNLYRMRVTQHLQQLLRQGYDNGISVLLDARRSSARRTILNGPQTSNPPKIVFVYTE